MMGNKINMYFYQKPKTSSSASSRNSWLNDDGRDEAKTKPLTIVEIATPTTSATTTTSAETFENTTTKLRKTTKTIITFIAAYFEDSNIHGLQYVVKGGLTTIEKCLWLTLLIISMYFCVEIGLQSVDRYYTKSTVVGLERDFHYWNTTMPSATICPLIRLDLQLFNEYCRQRNLNEQDKLVFYDFLEKLANATYSNFYVLPNNRSIDIILDRLKIKPHTYMELIYNLTGDPVLRYKADLHDFSDKIRSTTGDMIIESRQVLTEYGLCYMTNTMLTDKFSSLFMIWGKYAENEIRGEETVMQVKVASNFDSDVSYNFLGFNEAPIDGFLHSPYDVMRVDHNLGYTNEALNIEVNCMEIITDEGFESGASVEQRKCRFQHENNLTHYPVYSKNICMQECRLNLVYNMCKCIPHFYPNRVSNPKPVCNYKVLLECFVEHEQYFVKLYKLDKNGEKEHYPCYCAQNCLDSIVNKRAKLKMEKTNSFTGGNCLLFAMINLPTYRLKRLIIFSFTDLLVSIGGTAGLFLGFSVLCLVELIYHFTLRLFVVVIRKILE